MNYSFRIGPSVIRLEFGRPPQAGIPSLYAPFVCGEDNLPHLTVRVRTGEAPTAGKGARCVAEHSNHWALLEQGEGWRFEVYDQILFRPLSVVLFSRSHDEADFFPIVRADDPRLRRIGWFVGEVFEPFVQWWLTGHLALKRIGIILHASAVLLRNGKGLVFVGPSGAGKTTLAQLCSGIAGWKVLNDERVLLWRAPQGWRVAGTPWAGMRYEASSLSAPLQNLFILSKAQTDHFTAFSPGELLSRLAPEAFWPVWEAGRLEGFLEANQRLAEEVPGGILQFQNGPSVISYLSELAGEVPEPIGIRE